MHRIASVALTEAAKASVEGNNTWRQHPGISDIAPGVPTTHRPWRSTCYARAAAAAPMRSSMRSTTPILEQHHLMANPVTDMLISTIWQDRDARAPLTRSVTANIYQGLHGTNASFRSEPGANDSSQQDLSLLTTKRSYHRGYVP